MTEGDRNMAEWRRAFSARGDSARPREDCPDPPVLWQAANGELEPRALTPILDHVTTCPSCVQAWQLARAIELEHLRETEGPPAVWFWERWRRLFQSSLPEPVSGSGLELGKAGGGGAAVGSGFTWRWVAAAGLAAALGLVGLQQLSPDRPALRGADQVITSPLPAEAGISRQEFRLSWEGPPQQTYTVVVFARDGLEQIYFETGLEAFELVVPAAAFEGMPEGERIHWMVETTLPDGSSVRETFVARLD